MADVLRVELRQAGPIPLDVDLTCRPGDLVAIVGPSGSGKSTILRSVAGLYRPETGRVALDGTVWFDTATRTWVPPHRRAVGLVFQEYALFPHMTAHGNVAAALGHRPRAERAGRAAALLELVNLAGLEQRRPAELSGGQRQRVALARALARDPKVLLLDEPFSAVDRTTRRRLHDELGQLRRALALPILLVTHDFDEAARLADRMCLLSRGRVIQTGTPTEVLARPTTAEAARLLDLRNLFAGRIAAHDTGRDLTLVDWQGMRLEARRQPHLAIGSEVTWTAPSTQLTLLEPDEVAGTTNAWAGTTTEVLALLEGTRVVVQLDAAPGARLALTLPANLYGGRTWSAGSAVVVGVVPDAIHLIAGA